MMREMHPSLATSLGNSDLGSVKGEAGEESQRGGVALRTRESLVIILVVAMEAKRMCGALVFIEKCQKEKKNESAGSCLIIS